MIYQFDQQLKGYASRSESQYENNFSFAVIFELVKMI